MNWKIQVKNLSIYESNRNVNLFVNLSFNIEKGESLALVGPTGSGKTTFAYALMGLLPPNLKMRGKIDFLGESINWKLGKEMGMIFQDPHRALNPFLNVKNHLKALMPKYFFDDSNLFKELEEFSLPSSPSFLKKFPHELSGGEKQRLLILMALWNKPRLLVADEPTTSLDIHLKIGMLNLLKKLQKEREFTLLLLSHDELALSYLVDRQVALKDQSSASI